jgi:hypothetical protein
MLKLLTIVGGAYLAVCVGFAVEEKIEESKIKKARKNFFDTRKQVNTDTVEGAWQIDAVLRGLDVRQRHTRIQNDAAC